MEKQEKNYEFRTQATFRLTQQDCSTIEGESQTEPNQTLSIREILDRFGSGIKPPIEEGQYSVDSEDFDQPDLEKLRAADMVDRSNTITATRYKLEQLEQEQLDREAEAKATEEAERLAKAASETK